MTTDTAPRVHLLDLHPSVGDLRGEILAGLRKPLKTLPPKYFYDALGSELFDQITELPEYYPTETELKIMRDNVAEMSRLIGPGASLIELGSGSSAKIHILLDHLHEVAAYVPVEISKQHLLDAARRIAEDYPELDVRPVCADFTQPFTLPQPEVMPRRNVVYFPGSTIGNFYPEQAVALLKVMGNAAREGGALLIGVDLKKDRDTLERAYNDEAGVTARFNLNILRRINRDLAANFKLDNFAHRAIYNDDKGRIEMHLVSSVDQTVTVAGEAFDFRRDEYILSECSHKYSIDEFTAMAAQAGFAPGKAWVDDDELFSVHYLVHS